MVIRKLIILLSFVFVASCTIIHPVLTALPNTSKALDLNGYYYNLDFEDTTHNTSTIRIVILYDEGISFGLNYGICINKISLTDNEITDYCDRKVATFLSDTTYKNISKWWGTYLINDKSIEFKKVGGRMGETLIIYAGEIINETTFIIRENKISGSLVSSENGVKTKNDTYYFKFIESKPEVTTKFTIGK